MKMSGLTNFEFFIDEEAKNKLPLEGKKSF